MLARFLSNTWGVPPPSWPLLASPCSRWSEWPYAIQVNTGGDPTSSLLQKCASDPAKFYLLTTADQITATFQTIGTNLTKLINGGMTEDCCCLATNKKPGSSSRALHSN